jgi:hypothetical protein
MSHVTIEKYGEIVNSTNQVRSRHFMIAMCTPMFRM